MVWSKEAGRRGWSSVSGADESGMPRPQLRGSGAGGGQCSSTDPEFFHWELAHPQIRATV